MQVIIFTQNSVSRWKIFPCIRILNTITVNIFLKFFSYFINYYLNFVGCEVVWI